MPLHPIWRSGSADSNKTEQRGSHRISLIDGQNLLAKFSKALTPDLPPVENRRGESAPLDL